MKKNIHPQDYRLVVFSDEAAGFSFLTRSTAPTTETIKWEDGKDSPLVKIHISSASQKIIDTEGRVDRFKAKFEAARKHKEALEKKLAAQKAPKAKKADKNDK